MKKESLAERIVTNFSEGTEISEENKIRAIFSLNVLISNVPKLISIFLLAIITRSFAYTLVCYFSFLVLRRYIYGYHMMTDFQCLVLSILNFWLVPLFVKHYFVGVQPNNWLYVALNMVFLGLIVAYGAKGTSLNPVRSEKRKKLKIKATLVILVLTGLLLFMSHDLFKISIVFGEILAVLNILPFVDKIYQKIGGITHAQNA